MKNLIVALLFLLPIIGNAQSFWNVVHDNTPRSHITDKRLFQDSIIVFTKANTVACLSRWVYVYNTDGEIL